MYKDTSYHNFIVMIFNYAQMYIANNNFKIILMFKLPLTYFYLSGRQNKTPTHKCISSYLFINIPG